MVTRREDLPRLRQELIARVSESVAHNTTRSAGEILEESIFWERRRLAEDRGSPAHARDTQFWNELQQKLRRSPNAHQLGLLKEAVNHYAGEIEGHFDPRIYTLVTRAIPPAMGMVLNAVSPLTLARRLPSLPSLDDCVTIQGEIEHLRSLREKGTVILVPTHLSNLDSVVMGYALYRLGLPPFVYGAGLNLFRNRLFGFFMHNLGAYTVDRKKNDPLYKEVLKQYATLTLEFGYDNLFFPGGTRSRAGAVERRLKLGLLGTGLSAYIQNLARNAERPNVYIVPATISYRLVLEAETLISDFLSAVGKNRYIIEDDEFSRPRQILDFLAKLVSLDSRIHITISRGIDPFGNPVNDDGVSLDPQGRSIDIARYTHVNGEPSEVDDRDSEYTKEAAERISDAFFRDNVLESTHVTARAVFDALRARNQKMGVFQLIRTHGGEDEVPMLDLYERTERILADLSELESKRQVRVGDSCRQPADDVVSDGLAHFSKYHTRPAAERRGDRVLGTDTSLLLYYQNRLEGYPVGVHRPVLTEDHRSLRPREF
ncbi:MAG: 1-acyl-sn-glycerol-3-phosphate acyltransferase [Myxococcota bacterium]